MIILNPRIVSSIETMTPGTDDIPEQAFLNVGTIEDVLEKAKQLKEQAN